jgi:hypothetical protein
MFLLSLLGNHQILACNGSAKAGADQILIVFKKIFSKT